MTRTDGGAARLLRVYAVWIVLVTAVVIAAAVGVSMTAPRVYRSEAIVVVEARVRAGTTPVAPDMGTEKELARSGAVVDPAAFALEITSGQLLEGLVVSVAPDANVLTFTYTAGDPVTAQSRAESLAMAYVAYRNAGEAESTPTGAPTTSTQHATLVTDAVVPGAPLERSIWIYVGVGVAVGLLLGVGTALIRDRMNDRIRGRDDFERVSGATVLATVPRHRRRRPGGQLPVILRAPESPAAESFRYLRSRLQPNLRGATTVLVTSAGGREGRTTTAANLAVAMAQAGLTVVLIDADLRDPRLHTVFGDDNTTGLTGVLAGEVTLQQALQATSVQGLRLLTAGAPAANAGDLLSESRLRPLLDGVAATCDVVILDSAPVLSVSDPITLAAVCDHVLLVGNYRRTTRRYVTRALHELADVVHGNVSGVLLNAPRRAGGFVPNGRPQHAGAKAIAGTGDIAPAVTGSAPDAGATAIAGTGEVAPAVTGSAPDPGATAIAGTGEVAPAATGSVPAPRVPRVRRVRPAPTVDSPAPASTLATAGHDRAQTDHPSGAEMPAQAREVRRRLIRRG